MSFEFKELDYQQTPHGAISLRRRAEPRLGGKILYEVKLGDEFLMSSLFTEAEEQLATMGLGTLRHSSLDVVVGGLGLGYTAWSALQDKRVQSLIVIEVMQPVIDWHERGLVPLGEKLTSNPRCSLRQSDFFELTLADSYGYDDTQPDKRVHAVLLDIDHSPSHWLNPENQDFYTMHGLQKLTTKLCPGGLFGLWSNDPPDEKFMNLISRVFAAVDAKVISFPNPYNMGGESTNTIYLAHTAN